MRLLTDDELLALLAEAGYVRRPSTRQRRIHMVSRFGNLVPVQMGGNHPRKYVESLLAMGSVQGRAELLDRFFPAEPMPTHDVTDESAPGPPGGPAE